MIFLLQSFIGFQLGGLVITYSSEFCFYGPVKLLTHFQTVFTYFFTATRFFLFHSVTLHPTPLKHMHLPVLGCWSLSFIFSACSGLSWWKQRRWAFFHRAYGKLLLGFQDPVIYRPRKASSADEWSCGGWRVKDAQKERKREILPGPLWLRKKATGRLSLRWFIICEALLRYILCGEGRPTPGLLVDSRCQAGRLLLVPFIGQMKS